MTPKEKAEELFKKFLDATLAYDCGDHTAEGINNSILVMVKEAKQCALIAVYEVINTGLLSYKSTDNTFLAPTTEPYWQEVKKEITNL